MALAARGDINLLRAPIEEPARYYHSTRTIVVRTGLLVVQERRHLWHELVHADRGDLACNTDERAERSVDREAAERAMPLLSLEWAFEIALHEHEAADLLKVPQYWLRFRLREAHPATKPLIERAKARHDEHRELGA